MTFTNLEKYMYSKKCLKQRRQPSPPTLSPAIKVKGIFAQKESPSYGCYLQLNMPIQQIEQQKVPFIVHLRRLFPAAQDQEGYFKSAEFLNNCHKSLHIYN